MRNPSILLFVLGTVTAVPSQNPCTAPGSLATVSPFQATNWLAAPGQDINVQPPIAQVLPPGYRGPMILANLQAQAALSVSRLDVLLNDDGLLWSSYGQSGFDGLLGRTSTCEVYLTPGTWQATGATTTVGWTLAATGTLTVARRTEHSPIAFATPLTIPAGTSGMLLVIGPVTTPVAHITATTAPYALHPYLVLAASAPGVPLAVRDQFLSVANVDIGRVAFSVGPGPAPKVVPLEFHYKVGDTVAWSTAYGAGCYDRPKAFYELFEVGTFDLANRALEMTPAGGSYRVQPVTAPVVTPTSAPLQSVFGGPLGDDDRTAALPLGFTFPYAGRSTTSVVVNSNGCIYLDPPNSGNAGRWFELVGVGGFIDGQPSLAPYFMDLDPTRGGSAHLHVDLGAPVPVAYVTWLAVPEWGTNDPQTIQVAMFADGRVQYRYGACSISTWPTLVGFTAGFANDPGPVDVSAAMPFLTGDGALPPALRLDGRPVLGTTPNLVVDDMPAGAAGTVLVGLPIPGIDLEFLGMPGCVKRVLPLSLHAFKATGSVGSVPFAVPSSTWLRGVRLHAQSLAVSSGSNRAGRTISNALCIRLGQ